MKKSTKRILIVIGIAVVGILLGYCIFTWVRAL